MKSRIRKISMAGQERREMRFAGDRTDARPAAAMRNAKRLVQVEMRNVGAEVSRCSQSDERVQVGAIDVDLAAVLVQDRTDSIDAGLEDAVRRRIRHHDRGQI